MTAPEGGRRHRRGAAVHDAVLAETLTVLAEQGFGFSVDDVAERVGVHKTTIYRRWPTKPQLVAAAVDTLAARTVVPKRSGDPLADLRALAVQVARAVRSPAGRNALRATLAAAGSDPELAAVAHDFFARRYAEATPLIAEAQAAGLVRGDVDPVLCWQAIVNPMHLDAVCGVDTTDRRAGALVDLVLRGAR